MIFGSESRGIHDNILLSDGSGSLQTLWFSVARIVWGVHYLRRQLSATLIKSLFQNPATEIGTDPVQSNTHSHSPFSLDPL
jgi:hypothetical protein